MYTWSRMQILILYTYIYIYIYIYIHIYMITHANTHYTAHTYMILMQIRIIRHIHTWYSCKYALYCLCIYDHACKYALYCTCIHNDTCKYLYCTCVYAWSRMKTRTILHMYTWYSCKYAFYCACVYVYKFMYIPWWDHTCT